MDVNLGFFIETNHVSMIFDGPYENIELAISSKAKNNWLDAKIIESPYIIYNNSYLLLAVYKQISMKEIVKPILIPCETSICALTHYIIGYTQEDIKDIIGFPPKTIGDTKYHSWSFHVIDSNDICTVWEWEKTVENKQFSANGNVNILNSIFGANHVNSAFTKNK